MTTLVPLPWQFFDDNGTPLDGCKLYSYEGGSAYAVPKNTYTTAEGNVANANPTVYDAGGKAQIWIGAGLYDFRLYDKNDHLIETWDGIGGTDMLTSAVVIETMKNLRALDPGTYTAINLLGYNEAGDGGGGFFYWSSTSTAADDNGCIIQPSMLPSSGRWVRLVDEFVTPKMFGAYAQFQYNDSTAFIDANAYAAANNMYINVTGGTYLIDASITFTAKIVMCEGALLDIAAGHAPSSIELLNSPDSQIFACALADTPVLINSVVKPTWFPNGDINYALKALPIGGGTVILEKATYTAIDGTNVKSNTIILGAKKPEITSSNTGLANGTIIRGPLIITDKNIKLSNLGVDSGSTVCTTFYDSTDVEGINIIGATNAVKVELENVSAITRTATGCSAIILQNVINSTLYNISVQYGTNGIEIVGKNVIGDNIECFQHASNAISIVNTETLTSENILLSSVCVDGQELNGTCAVHIGDDVSEEPLTGVVIHNLIVKDYKNGVLIGGETSVIKYVSIQLRYIPNDQTIANYQITGAADNNTCTVDVGTYHNEIVTLQSNVSTLQSKTIVLENTIGTVEYGKFTANGRTADFNGTPPSVNIYYKKTTPSESVINAQVTVELSIPFFSGDSKSTTMILDSLPSDLRPKSGYFRRYFLCQLMDNSNTDCLGSLMISQSDGEMGFYKYPTGSFTTENSKGCYPVVIKYSLS